LNWEKKRILVTAKAYPEKSTKYGETVCVAGITEEGEFIRLYPVHFNYFRKGNNKIRKFSWIEVECAKNVKEKLQRKESYKLRDLNGIKIIDEELTKQPVKWKPRNELIKPLVSESIEFLQEKYKEDKTSLGIVKVHELNEFYSRKPVDEIDMEQSKIMQATLFQGKQSILQQMPHIFRYKFKCSPDCPTIHDMSVEDWEVFEFFRNGFTFYKGDYDVLWEKMKERFDSFMKTRDLHFILGTDSQWAKWMIIGIYYPPK
jgi:hypothetical protein